MLRTTGWQHPKELSPLTTPLPTLTIPVAVMALLWPHLSLSSALPGHPYLQPQQKLTKPNRNTLKKKKNKKSNTIETVSSNPENKPNFYLIYMLKVIHTVTISDLCNVYILYTEGFDVMKWTCRYSMCQLFVRVVHYRDVSNIHIYIHIFHSCICVCNE